MKSLISFDGSATLSLDGSTLSDGSQSKIVDGSASLGIWVIGGMLI